MHHEYLLTSRPYELLSSTSKPQESRSLGVQYTRGPEVNISRDAAGLKVTGHRARAVRGECDSKKEMSMTINKMQGGTDWLIAIARAHSFETDGFCGRAQLADKGGSELAERTRDSGEGDGGAWPY